MMVRSFIERGYTKSTKAGYYGGLVWVSLGEYRRFLHSRPCTCQRDSNTGSEYLHSCRTMPDSTAPDLSPISRIASRLTPAPRSRDMTLAAPIPRHPQFHGFGQFRRCCSTLQTCFAAVVRQPSPPGVHAGRPCRFGLATRNTLRFSSRSRHPRELLTQPGYCFAEHLFLTKCSNVQS